MTRQIVIGVCGGSVAQRKEVIGALADLKGSAITVDVTVPPSIRAPWRRGEALANNLGTELDAMAPTPLVLASICSFEESEEIEALGGEVIHIEGLPSDDVPITRQTIMVSTRKVRGRYVNPAMALMQIEARTA